MPKKGKQANASNSVASRPTGQAVQSKGAKRRARKQAALSADVMAPVNMGRVLYSGKPSIVGSSAHSITITHREYIKDVTCSAVFALEDGQYINPGIESSFPWLAAIARKFESYSFKKLTYSYEPLCSTSTGGIIYLAIDFDAVDSAPKTKSDITAYAGCTKGQAWMPFKMTANPMDLQKFTKEKFTRGGRPLNVDLKTYDSGVIWNASCGGTGAVTGELYVEYTVELITPQNDVDWINEESGKVTAGGTVSITAPFGTVPALTGALPLEVNVAGNEITFPEVGQYLLDFVLGGTVFNGTAPTIGGTAATTTDYNPLYNAAATAARWFTQANVTLPGQTVTFDFTPSATTLTSNVLRVAPYLFTL